eukprot:TRINITY_DN4734_c0_g3_i1.p1 TRINITY_DN4734_c0_g3~~TRINITY_DN4734_c0_g3_i1.p1  ORF type:complete len:164 (-),score=52.18 TRINITY_DN4734_c0_g3_i1:25-516(-)
MTPEQAMHEAKLISTFKKQMKHVSKGMNLYLGMTGLNGMITLFAIFFTFTNAFRVSLWINTVFALFFPFPSIVDHCKTNTAIQDNLNSLATDDIAADWSIEQRSQIIILLKTAKLKLKFVGKTLTWGDLFKAMSSFGSIFFLFFQLSRSPQIVALIGVPPILK